MCFWRCCWFPAITSMLVTCNCPMTRVYIPVLLHCPPCLWNNTLAESKSHACLRTLSCPIRMSPLSLNNAVSRSRLPSTAAAAYRHGVQRMCYRLVINCRENARLGSNNDNNKQRNNKCSIAGFQLQLIHRDTGIRNRVRRSWRGRVHHAVAVAEPCSALFAQPYDAFGGCDGLLGDGHESCDETEVG